MASLEVLYKHSLLNTTDKSILALKVTSPPSAQTPPHTHHGASVSVVGLTGSLLNKMNDDPMAIVKPGDSFYESPSCIHQISANASTTEEASMLATFVLETEKLDAILARPGGPLGLVVLDEEFVRQSQKL